MGGCLNNQPVISLISTGKCMPLGTFLWITFRILSISVVLAKTFVLNYWYLSDHLILEVLEKNVLSSLSYASDITPSWNGDFSSKSRLISELVYSELGDLCKPSWLLGMLDLIGLGGSL